ncbi:hypothetical protein Airi02_053240 [Actinoallomurus iriomotensis]|uniref:Uncharacterized protein n=1 Tax=Actinoallomurus iriomotensis TaxID=478107 RepID=A0A9W6W0Z6_9ACTN|nr:hypothetical protein Airi02_053240 [Actinoallomurus iriomotensis]
MALVVVAVATIEAGSQGAGNPIVSAGFTVAPAAGVALFSSPAAGAGPVRGLRLGLLISIGLVAALGGGMPGRR